LKKPGQLAKKRKHLSLAATFLIYCCYTFAQSKSGLENYSLVGNDHTYSWMPIAHYQAKKGFYTELRYNYEDVKTASLYCGKTFLVGTKKKIVLIPMIGGSAGTFSGVSAALKTEGDFDRCFASTELQYSWSLNPENPGFMFSWTEAGLNLAKNFFAGVTIQTTLQRGANEFEPGVMLGFTAGRLCVPVYFFKPFSTGNYMMIGLNYELQFLGKRKV